MFSLTTWWTVQAACSMESPSGSATGRRVCCGRWSVVLDHAGFGLGAADVEPLRVAARHKLLVMCCGMRSRCLASLDGTDWASRRRCYRGDRGVRQDVQRAASLSDG